MASSNRTGLGVKKKRSKQVLKTSIEILTEFSQWAKEENEDPYMAIRDLYEFTYDDWRTEGRQVSWTQKEFSSLLSSHVRQPIEGFPKLVKCRKLNKHGLREMHYKVIENA
tara:strand:+ start:637 stop:969 length:333 start_codon:yes stop_codon:yes gene_type:complete